MMEQHIWGFKTFEAMPGGPDIGGLFSESSITFDDLKSIVNDIIGGRNLSFSLALPPFMNLASDESSSLIGEDWKVNDEWNFTHLLDLEGKDFRDIWKKYKSKTRTHIRKAKKSGLETRNATSLNDYKAFYDIYTKVSQNWGYKTPPIPYKLLENLYKYGSHHVNLSLAIKDDEIIAGLLYFSYAKTVYLYMSSFLPEYGRFNPARLLDCEAIEQACREGFKYVNFGPSANFKHIRKYKEGFGTEKVELNRYKVYSNLGKMVNKINFTNYQI
jgi:lipid II:glycine glycyltransferase (peptidoglycan interpeptide bridge formation enzyme)